MICEHALDIDVVTLDTGRLFPEPTNFGKGPNGISAAVSEPFIPIPSRFKLERNGINGFYQTREVRQACCFVRKIEPLNLALVDAQAWVVGLGAEQSANRKDMQLLSADFSTKRLKLSPLFDWTRKQVVKFLTAHNIPANPLHAKGFASIGCAPCTRAIQPGEPERAGRWWWEDEHKKERGLHAQNQ